MPVDEQIAESSTATETPTDAFIATNRAEWLKNGTPFPKAEPEKVVETKPTEEAKPATEAVAAEETPTEVVEETPEAKMKAETQARFDELLKDRAELKERTAKLEKQLAELSKPAETKPADTKPEAKPEADAPVKRMSMKEYIEKNPGKEFEDYQDYCTDYAGDRAAERARKEFETLESARQTKAAEDERVSVFQSSVAEAKKFHPDVETVINGPTIPVSPVMEAFMSAQGPLGVRILYVLGKDFANTERIAALSPIDQLEELVLIKRQLSDAKEPKAETPKTAAPPPKKPSAAAPIGTQLAGTNSVPEDEAKAALAAGDFVRYRNIMNARDIARAKGN